MRHLLNDPIKSFSRYFPINIGRWSLIHHKRMLPCRLLFYTFVNTLYLMCTREEVECEGVGQRSEVLTDSHVWLRYLAIGATLRRPMWRGWCPQWLTDRVLACCDRKIQRSLGLNDRTGMVASRGTWETVPNLDSSATVGRKQAVPGRKDRYNHPSPRCQKDSVQFCYT